MGNNLMGNEIDYFLYYEIATKITHGIIILIEHVRRIATNGYQKQVKTWWRKVETSTIKKIPWGYGEKKNIVKNQDVWKKAVNLSLIHI